MNAAKGTRVAFYARVSTREQSAHAQLAKLREVAAREGWIITHEYVDEGKSGAKGRDKRPAYNSLLEDAEAGKFDLIAVWAVDRLSRSLSELSKFLEIIQSLKVNLYLDQQDIDTSTKYGKAMFQMAGIFAELEREIARARTLEGVKVANDEGRFGGRPKVSAEKETRIREMLDKRMGIKAIAKAVSVGISVVYRVKAEMESKT